MNSYRVLVICSAMAGLSAVNGCAPQESGSPVLDTTSSSRPPYELPVIDNGGGGRPVDGLPVADADVDAILPDVSGYNSMELSEGRKLLVQVAAYAQPEYRPALEGADEFIGCYERDGALKGRAYVDKYAWQSGGAVGVVDVERASSRFLLARCAVSALMDAIIPLGDDPKAIAPCATSYETTVDGREFIVAYAGTTAAFCHDMCSNLPGCGAH